MSEVISMPAAADSIAEPWQPRDLARVNESIVRIARLDGEFPWHAHEEDEAFLCWQGSFRIELEGAPPVSLAPGDLYVVARNTRHRPVADMPAVALLFERAATLQYGTQP